MEMKGISFLPPQLVSLIREIRAFITKSGYCDNSNVEEKKSILSDDHHTRSSKNATLFGPPKNEIK